MDLSERPAHEGPRHPWEVARFNFFASVVAHLASPPLRVLDAGAGDGWFARQLLLKLPSSAELVCWDAHYSADDLHMFGSQSDGRMTYRAEKPEGRFDLFVLLDVLEHIEDDHSFLTELVADHMAPSGHLLFSVPAHPALYSAHDAALKHHRRYAPKQAAAVLSQCGLKVLRSGGLFHSLVVPRALTCLLERARPKPVAATALTWKRGTLVTSVLSTALSWDNRASRLASKLGWQVPGLSWWALCEGSSPPSFGVWPPTVASSPHFSGVKPPQ